MHDGIVAVIIATVSVINLTARGRFKNAASLPRSCCIVRRADRPRQREPRADSRIDTCTDPRRGPLLVAAAVRERELSRHMRQGRRWLRCIGPRNGPYAHLYPRLEPLELEESTRMVNDGRMCSGLRLIYLLSYSWYWKTKELGMFRFRFFPKLKYIIIPGMILYWIFIFHAFRRIRRKNLTIVSLKLFIFFIFFFYANFQFTTSRR